MTEQPDEPKLIVDEDWKSRVQREKEELEQQQREAASSSENAESGNAEPGTAEPTSSESSTDAEATAVGEPSPEETSGAQALPPASLPMLVASLGAQAMASLGQLPDESGKPLPVNLLYAKHFIDLVGVIEDKTQGNLSQDEKRYVQETLHQLRLTFVDVKARQPKA